MLPVDRQTHLKTVDSYYQSVVGSQVCKTELQEFCLSVHFSMAVGHFRLRVMQLSYLLYNSYCQDQMIANLYFFFSFSGML